MQDENTMSRKGKVSFWDERGAVENPVDYWRGFRAYGCAWSSVSGPSPWADFFDQSPADPGARLPCFMQI